MKRIFGFILLFIIFSAACRKDDDTEPKPKGGNNNGSEQEEYNPTPYTLDVPEHFLKLLGEPHIPEDNPLTEEGVALGKKLFFEVKLSKNNLISCSSCHEPKESFNDKGNALSTGVDGNLGLRNAMPLINLAWIPKQGSAFNWNGSAESIEEQAFGPVRDPLEMGETWTNVEDKLQRDPNYPALFYEAFGTKEIDSNLVVKALAQFLRTLISGNTRFDNYVINYNPDIPPSGGPSMSNKEIRGFQLFMAEGKGDCFHCHGSSQNPLLTDNKFKNNGLDLNPDSGFAAVSGKPNDLGKFKVPTIRNLVFTAPYMHDGRFNTLREVVDFYADNVQENSPNIDGTMHKPRNLTNSEREELVAFLKAITDSSFVNNPKFQE